MVSTETKLRLLSAIATYGKQLLDFKTMNNNLMNSTFNTLVR